jgi:hypothetical protein
MSIADFSAQVTLDAGPCGQVLNVQIFERVEGDQRISASFVADLNCGPALVYALQARLADAGDALNWDNEKPSKASP